MGKPTAFISHITEESEIARHLKDLIDGQFLRSVKVFASSHEESIQLGDEWLNAIKASVENCGLMIVICSPISVTRPWINFEAGGGWVRGIPVVPMCHSGMEPGRLPVPLNSLQGGLLGNPDDVQKLFTRLATLADVDAPEANDAQFFDSIRHFETMARTNVLLKDTQFIASLLNRDIDILRYCIYASTQDREFMNTLELSDDKLSDCQFTFNDIHHMFNISLLDIFPNKKVYQVIQPTVLRIVDTIRFLLSNSRLNIANELEECLNTFLRSLNIFDKSSTHIEVFDQKNDGKFSIRDSMIKLIKEEPLPPTRQPYNVINFLIDYYDGLVFYKAWLVNYKEIIERFTGRG